MTIAVCAVGILTVPGRTMTQEGCNTRECDLGSGPVVDMSRIVDSGWHHVAFFARHGTAEAATVQVRFVGANANRRHRGIAC